MKLLTTCKIDLLHILGYIDDLYKQLDHYVSSNSVPNTNDRQVASLASRGPSYASIDEVDQETEKKRRGLTTKPYYLTGDELELARKRTERAKKSAAKKKSNKR